MSKTDVEKTEDVKEVASFNVSHSAIDVKIKSLEEKKAVQLKALREASKKEKVNIESNLRDKILKEKERVDKELEDKVAKLRSVYDKAIDALVNAQDNLTERDARIKLEQEEKQKEADASVADQLGE